MVANPRTALLARSSTGASGKGARNGPGRHPAGWCPTARMPSRGALLAPPAGGPPGRSADLRSGVPMPVSAGSRRDGDDPTSSLVNLSALDRAVRLLAGAVMLAAGWWLAGDSTLKAALEVYGWVPLLTGALGWDPFYAILGIRTRRGARAERPRRAR
jgi:Protein of unknown function (DUF2892)